MKQEAMATTVPHHRVSLSNEEQLWLMQQVKNNAMTIDEAVDWTEMRENELRSQEDDVTVTTLRVKTNNPPVKRSQTFNAGKVFKSLIGRNHAKKHEAEKRPSTDVTMDGISSFAHDFKNKQIYNFSIHRYLKHRTPQKRILQIDFDAKQVSMIQHGNVDKTYSFSSLVSVDGQEGKKIFIYFDDGQEIELNAENLADKTKLIRLLNIINEQNEFEERGQHFDPCEKLQLSFKVIKEGYLEKKGTYSASSWHKRLVTIRSGELAYYRLEEEEQSAALNIIHLSPGSVAISLEESNVFTMATTRESYRFRLPESPALSLKAQERIRDEWINAIEEGCNRHAYDSASTKSSSDQATDQAAQQENVAGSFNLIYRELENLKKMQENSFSFDSDSLKHISKMLQLLQELQTSSHKLIPNGKIVKNANQQHQKEKRISREASKIKGIPLESNAIKRSSMHASYTNPFAALSIQDNDDICITNIDDMLLAPSPNLCKHSFDLPVTPDAKPANKTNTVAQTLSTEDLLQFEESNPYELAEEITVKAGSQIPLLTKKADQLPQQNGIEDPSFTKRSSVQSDPPVTFSFSRLSDASSLPPPPDESPTYNEPENTYETVLPPPPSPHSLQKATDIDFPPTSEMQRVPTLPLPRSPHESKSNEGAVPPPPPPPPPMFIPPPPPSMPVAPLLSPTSMEKQSSKPNHKTPMRPFHWAPVPNQSIGKSMWKNAENVSRKIDTNLLYECFHVTNDKKKASIDDNSIAGRVMVLPANATPRKKQAESYLDRKIAQNLGIFLAGFKVRGEELKKKIMIVKEEDGGMGTEHIMGLRKFCPEPELKSLYAKHAGSEEELSKEDRFMAELCKIPRLGLRLETLSIVREIPQEIESLQPEVDLALNACQELLQSKLLESLLGYILAITNHINSSNSKGTTKGIRLSSLEKTTVMRTNDRKLTLLQVVLMIVKKEQPEVLRLGEELKSFSKAQSYSLKGLAAEIDVMRKTAFKAKKNSELFRRKKNLPSKEDITFCSVIEAELSSLDAKISSMGEKCVEIKKTLGKVLIKFGESPDTDCQELFGWIRDFLENFKKSLPK